MGETTRRRARPKGLTVGSKLALGVALLLGLNSVFVVWYFPREAYMAARTSASSRAADLAAVLARAVSTGVEFEDIEAIEERLGDLESAADSRYAAVIRDGVPLAAWNRENIPTELTLSESAEVWEADGNLHATAPVDLPGENTAVAVGFSLAKLEAAKSESESAAYGVALILLVLGIALSFGVGALISRPIRELTVATQRVVRDGRLDLKIEVDSNDEVGILADSFRHLLGWLRDTVGGLNELVQRLGDLTEQLNRAGSTVSDGANKIHSQAQESSVSISQLRGSLQGLEHDVKILESSADQGGSTIMDMATTNDEVARKVQGMAEAAKVTSQTVERIAGAFVSISERIDELRETALETSSSVTEIATSIQDVERSAGHTARLSEEASHDAESGAEALDKTLEGIATIQHSTDVADTVIQALGFSVSEIGSIINVIQDVASQTNLLALNASIIAAQSGDYGGGFAVVADEIKTLADRTRNSTAEISTLIGKVREESEQAQVAMGEGGSNVRDGVVLGTKAGEALAKILQSTQQAQGMVKAIAQATREQAVGTSRVADSIQRMSIAVQDLSDTSGAQTRNSQAVVERAGEMRIMTEEVERAGRAQAEGSQRVIDTIAQIKAVVGQVSNAHREQSRASEKVLSAVEEIQSVAHSQGSAAKDLEHVIEALRKQAQQLRAEIERFEL